jgi:hypothetical protein
MIRVELKDGELLVEPQALELFAEKFYRVADPDVNKRPTKKLFNKCIVFANHYLTLDTKVRKLYDDIPAICGTGKFKGQAEIRNWCDSFLSDLKDATDIKDFIDVAEASGNETLFAIACLAIVNDMRDLEVDEFRKKYNIKNDFTSDEIKQLREEDKLWNAVNAEALQDEKSD